MKKSHKVNKVKPPEKTGRLRGWRWRLQRGNKSWERLGVLSLQGKREEEESQVRSAETEEEQESKVGQSF